MIEKCPLCDKPLVLPRGDAKSKLLILSVKPGEKELEELRPFVGNAGRVLRTELARVGLDMLSFRISNLFLHETTKKGSVTGEPCFDWCFEQALEETKNKDWILLMGADVVKKFCEINVMSVSGLEVRSHMISPRTRLFAAPNPADANRGGVGEVRLAIENFNKAYRESNIIKELGYD